MARAQFVHFAGDAPVMGLCLAGLEGDRQTFGVNKRMELGR